jgi:hypothetical protein
MRACHSTKPQDPKRATPSEQLPNHATATRSRPVLLQLTFQLSELNSLAVYRLAEFSDTNVQNIVTQSSVRTSRKRSSSPEVDWISTHGNAGWTKKILSKRSSTGWHVSAAIRWLSTQGVVSLKTLWAELAHLRRTAAVLLCVESTRPDPLARWCGEGWSATGNLTRIRCLHLGAKRRI